MARGLLDGLFRLDPAGFLRAGAIITGLAIATVGYVVGSISQNAVTHRDVRQRICDKSTILEDELI